MTAIKIRLQQYINSPELIYLFFSSSLSVSTEKRKNASALDKEINGIKSETYVTNKSNIP